MKTTMKNKPVPKVKKYEAGGAQDLECVTDDRGKKRCKRKSKSVGKSVEKAGLGILGTLGTIAGGIGAYKGFKKLTEKKSGGASKYKMGGVKKSTARTRK